MAEIGEKYPNHLKMHARGENISLPFVSMTTCHEKTSKASSGNQLTCSSVILWLPVQHGDGPQYTLVKANPPSRLAG